MELNTHFIKEREPWFKWKHFMMSCTACLCKLSDRLFGTWLLLLTTFRKKKDEVKVKQGWRWERMGFMPHDRPDKLVLSSLFHSYFLFFPPPPDDDHWHLFFLEECSLASQGISSCLLLLRWCFKFPVRVSQSREMTIFFLFARKSMRHVFPLFPPVDALMWCCFVVNDISHMITIHEESREGWEGVDPQG